MCADVKSLQTSPILDPNLGKVEYNFAKAREFAPVQVYWSFRHRGSMYVSYLLKGGDSSFSLTALLYVSNG